jgi:hypothetical protein
MIAFGAAVTDPDAYERYAQPGIRLAAEPDTIVLPLGSAGLGKASIFRNYNLLIEQAAQLDGLEALVLIHQDAEIVDADFCEKLRRPLADPDVGLVGCAGAVGVRNIAWWDGSVTFASFSHQYEEYGGGEIHGSTWDLTEAPPEARTGEVEVIDGFVMGLTPWAIENLRFDESLGQLHGYDFDFCQQVRAAGKKIVTEHLRVIHHHSLELINDVEGWVAAHMRIAEKWEDQIPPPEGFDGDWKQRARWAEARRDAAMMEANAAELARVAALEGVSRRVWELEEQLESVETSASWRLTRPLRALKRLRSRGGSQGEPPGPAQP